MLGWHPVLRRFPRARARVLRRGTARAHPELDQGTAGFGRRRPDSATPRGQPEVPPLLSCWHLLAGRSGLATQRRLGCASSERSAHPITARLRAVVSGESRQGRPPPRHHERRLGARPCATGRGFAARLDGQRLRDHADASRTDASEHTRHMAVLWRMVSGAYGGNRPCQCGTAHRAVPELVRRRRLPSDRTWMGTSEDTKFAARSFGETGDRMPTWHRSSCS